MPYPDRRRQGAESLSRSSKNQPSAPHMRPSPADLSQSFCRSARTSGANAGCPCLYSRHAAPDRCRQSAESLSRSSKNQPSAPHMRPSPADGKPESGGGKLRGSRLSVQKCRTAKQNPAPQGVSRKESPAIRLSPPVRTVFSPPGSRTAPASRGRSAPCPDSGSPPVCPACSGVCRIRTEGHRRARRHACLRLEAMSSALRPAAAAARLFFV